MKGAESLPSQLCIIYSLCPLSSRLNIDPMATGCEYVVAFDVAIVLPAPFIEFCNRNVSVSKSYRPTRRGNCTTRHLLAPYDMV
jgi:hypothetical protein